MEQDSAATFAEFTAAWGDLVGAVVRARGRETHLGEDGLTMAQAMLMRAVAALDRPTVGAIAHALHIASPSATRMLQQLERKGMVERHRDPEDERTILVTVTPRGEQTLTRWRAHVTERQRRLFDRIDPAQRPLLIALLREMGAAIEDS
ncbi:MarR family winged helix-turn-helix transcriptional regulator [Marinactinospora rubrisoli]|uniref:MarR family winged helix-turn-helix transcriptional regulator n=1 Tax=Marinactinospora rubrisoli TaxID=2715399 RepID=A0ABW2K995_9ACTN